MAKQTTLYMSDGSTLEEVLVATDYSLVKNKPDNFPPTAHNHDASNITSGIFPQSKVAFLEESLNIGLDTPITSLNYNTLNDVFSSNLFDTEQLSLDTPFTELNNHTLKEVFEYENAVFGIGKNLLNPFLEIGTISSLGVNSTDTERIRSINYIQVKPSTTYTLGLASGYLGQIFFEYDSDYNFLLRTIVPTLTTMSNTKYIRVVYRSEPVRDILSSDLEANVSKPQIELGSTATTYEPYKSTENNDLPPFVNWFNLDYFGISSLTTVQMDYYYTLYNSLSNNVSLPNEISNDYYTNNDIIIYLEPFKANQQYSPLYQTTFDLMTDNEIKLQMDEFVAKPYLFIDYETLGIELSTSEMDFWYSLYQKLKNDYSRPASDVSSWAKAPTKPTYDASEIAETSSYKILHFTERAKIARIDIAENLSVALDSKAQISHASASGTYGLGSTTDYGHVKVRNDLSQSAHENGVSLSAYQGKVLKDGLDTVVSQLDSKSFKVLTSTQYDALSTKDTNTVYFIT